jgi:arylsulfatase
LLDQETTTTITQTKLNRPRLPVDLVPLIFDIKSLSCGYDFGEAVSHEYHTRFTFTRLIKQVTVDVSGDLIEDDESKVRMLMSQQ